MVLRQLHVCDEDMILITIASEVRDGNKILIKGRVGLHYQTLYNESWYAVTQEMSIVIPPERTQNNNNIKLLLHLEQSGIMDKIRAITADSSITYTVGYITEQLKKELDINPLETDMSSVKNAIRIGFNTYKKRNRI